MNENAHEHDHEELISVYKAPDETNANLVRSLLEAAGIEVAVASRQVPWMDGVMVSGEGYWGDVLVAEDRREESLAIIEAYRRPEPSAEPEEEEQQ